MSRLDGNTVIVRRSLACFALLACIAGGSAAYAQEFSEQRLDRIDVIEAQGATNVAPDIDVPTATKPWVATDYPAVSGTAFGACQNTSTRGLYCLDGNVVRHWPHPEKVPPLSAEDGRELFNCGNPVFALDKDHLCSALALDLRGNIWLAGKKKAGYSLFKVAQGACPTSPANTPASSWTAFSTPAGSFCVREFAAGRQPLIDFTVVGGAAATAFPYTLGSGGVLAIENATSVIFFPDSPQATPKSIATGANWGLVKGELLQSATLLQKPLPSNSRNWVPVVTSTGRLLSREIPWTNVSTPVIQHGAPINLVAPTSCGPTALYDIRTSDKTRATYVSDRRGCRLLTLASNVDTVATGAALAFTSQQVIASNTGVSPVATLTAPPQAISIAPGIRVDLRADCGFDSAGNPRECGIVPDGGDSNFVAAASIKGVRIDTGTLGGLTVFQVQNIPDCRYLSFAAQPAECKNGAIRAPDGRVIDNPSDPTEYTPSGFPLNPETLFLNVTPLLPPEVTSVATLPVMLMSPRYRALSDTNTFDALFGVTDDGVRFREKFIGNFHLGDLIPGRKLGCGGTATIDPVSGPTWDVILTISERFTTVGGLPGGGRQNTDMLVNVDGCDALDPPVSGGRWSLYAYGVKLAAPRVPNRTNPSVTEVRYPDSIFASLVLSLFSDLGATIDDYLCADRDGGNGAPLSGATCTTVQDQWANTFDKLTKCVQSSTEPMNSTEIRTCNAFEIQYGKFAPLVNGLAPASLDVGNRVGEAKVRLEVFRYVYDQQFKPSIPPSTGFIDGL